MIIALCAIATHQPPPEALRLEMIRVMSELLKISRPREWEAIGGSLPNKQVHAEDGTRPDRNWWTLYAKRCYVRFTDRREFRGFGTLGVSEVPNHRTDEELKAEALQVVRTIGFWGDRNEVRLERSSDGSARAYVDAFWGEMRATHNASIDFARHSLAMEHVFMWDRLDYTRFRYAPRVTKAAAVNAARSAYLSFSPFAIAEIGEARPFFGIPAMAETSPPEYHEISEGEFALFRDYVALPLYYVTIKNLGEYHPIAGLSVTVVVNAITGRAIVLYTEHPRSSDLHLRRRAAPLVDGEIRVDSPKGVASFVKETKQATGTWVSLKVGKYEYAARFDRASKTLFLPDQDGFRAYSADASLARHLVKVHARSPFAGGPPKATK
jgi:hypothetical protein